MSGFARLMAVVVSLAAVFAAGWALKALVGGYPQFGLGLCSGLGVAAFLYWLAERTGVHRSPY